MANNKGHKNISRRRILSSPLGKGSGPPFRFNYLQNDFLLHFFALSTAQQATIYSSSLLLLLGYDGGQQSVQRKDVEGAGGSPNFLEDYYYADRVDKDEA